MVARYDCSNRRSGSVGSFDASPSSEEEEEDELRAEVERESHDETSSSPSLWSSKVERRRCARVVLGFYQVWQRVQLLRRVRKWRRVREPWRPADGW